MFATMGVISFVVLVMSIIFGSEPPTPPGRAEANVADRRKNEKAADILQTLKEYKVSVKELFSSKEFLIIWIVLPLVSSTFRCNIVLLSSILLVEFPDKNDIDKHVGIALAIAWFMYTIGSLVTGPILSKTHRYKEVTCLSVLLTFASCFAILLGVRFGNIPSIFAGVILKGFSTGIFVTSAVELIAEVTYPEAPSLPMLISCALIGVITVMYSTVGRILLQNVSPTAATGFPVVLTLLSCFLLLFPKFVYKRQMANNEEMCEPLISSQTGCSSK